MFYNVLKLKDFAELGEEKFKKTILLEAKEGKKAADGEACRLDGGEACGCKSGALVLIGIKKGEIIDTHTSNKDAAVYVVDGKVELHFDAEKFEVGAGEILMFKKDEQHKVVAKNDSLFMIFKV